MKTHEERLAACDVELRAKYDADALREMAKNGEAMPDESYPIGDKDDVEKAVEAVGMGNADHDEHIITRAKALDCSDVIYDNWDSDGSLKESKAAVHAAEMRGESYKDLRDLLSTAIGNEFGGKNTWLYVFDFSDEWVTYEDEDGELKQVSYEIDGDTVSFGKPDLVRTVTTYEPVEVKSQARRARKPRHRAVPLLPEVRHWRAEGLEIRSDSKTDTITISGTPIVYDQAYTVCDLFGEFEETMRAGVAAPVLARGADVRFLFNHDGLPLARTLSGTLTLTDSRSSLAMSAALDARQQLANDLAIAVERGDVSQMSCGFIVARDDWDEREEHRDVLEFDDLLDVSAVTYPASPTTSLQIAQRMALEIPVESRARVRRIYAEIRAGKVLSQDHQDKLVEAASAIHSVLGKAGVDPANLSGSETDPNEESDLEGGRESNEDGTTGGNVKDDSAPGYPDMTGTRSDDPGEPIRTTSSTLRLQVEARRRRRVRV